MVLATPRPSPRRGARVDVRDVPVDVRDVPVDVRDVPVDLRHVPVDVPDVPVDTIQNAIDQSDTLDQAAHRWALCIVDAARLRRARTAPLCVAYLAKAGIETTPNALRLLGNRKRVWSTNVNIFNEKGTGGTRRRMKTRLYDPKELVTFYRSIRRRTKTSRS